MKKQHSWWVYMLRCADGTLYTGMAADVDKREKVHNAGKGARYTRSRLPVQVVYREECESRGDALRREAALKALRRSEKLELVKSFSNSNKITQNSDEKQQSEYNLPIDHCAEGSLVVQ